MTTTDDIPEFPVWDSTTLTRLMGDKPALQRRLLEKFLINARKQMSTIGNAARAGDIATISRVAHVLKSASRTVGAVQLGELCQKIETAGKAGDGVTCNALTERLNGSFIAATEAISKNQFGN